MIEIIVSGVGQATILYFVVKFLYKIYRYTSIFITPTYLDFSKYGKWAGSLMNFVLFEKEHVRYVA